MQSYISGQTMKWGIPFRNMHNGNMQLHVLPFLAHLSVAMFANKSGR
jgi:hypothetical protein